MRTTELEKAVEQLPPEELAQFAKWFEDYLADRWDEQIERDIQAGKSAGGVLSREPRPHSMALFLHLNDSREIKQRKIKQSRAANRRKLGEGRNVCLEDDSFALT